MTDLKRKVPHHSGGCCHNLSDFEEDSSDGGHGDTSVEFQAPPPDTRQTPRVLPFKNRQNHPQNKHPGWTPLLDALTAGSSMNITDIATCQAEIIRNVGTHRGGFTAGPGISEYSDFIHVKLWLCRLGTHSWKFWGPNVPPRCYLKDAVCRLWPSLCTLRRW